MPPAPPPKKPVVGYGNGPSPIPTQIGITRSGKPLPPNSLLALVRCEPIVFNDLKFDHVPSLDGSWGHEKAFLPNKTDWEYATIALTYWRLHYDLPDAAPPSGATDEWKINDIGIQIGFVPETDDSVVAVQCDAIIRNGSIDDSSTAGAKPWHAEVQAQVSFFSRWHNATSDPIIGPSPPQPEASSTDIKWG